tara:strand:+ start:238 stop:504 length:267 start_codon:yes stop_codon:yes gene_type:complete
MHLLGPTRSSPDPSITWRKKNHLESIQGATGVQRLNLRCTRELFPLGAVCDMGDIWVLDADLSLWSLKLMGGKSEPAARSKNSALKMS